MTPAEAEALIPLAAELVATTRDYGPADVAAVLDRVPDHRALAVVLAAMVDPDARPSELLKWVTAGPVRSRDAVPASQYVKAVGATSIGVIAERRNEVARLTALGVSAKDIAAQIGTDRRTVIRHRAAIRKAVGQAS